MGSLLGSQESRPSGDVRRANQILIDALFPGFITGSQRGGDQNEGIAGQITEFLEATGQDFASSLARPGATVPIRFSGGDIGTTGFGSIGNLGTGIFGGGQQGQGGVGLAFPGGISPAQGNVAQFPTGGGRTTGQQAGVPNTLLPSIGEIGQFTTAFEKFSSGQLDPASSQILNEAINAVSQPIGANSQALQQIVNTPAPASIPDPPGIGELTTKIFNNMPPEFQQFTQDILNDSTPQQIEQNLNEFTQALTEKAAADAESFGGQLLAQFASQGITGGAAIEGMKAVAINTAKQTNAQIAEARLNALDTMIKARDQGIQTMNSLLASGQAEQANIIRQRVANLEAQTAVQVAKIGALADVQRSLTALQGQQLALLGDLAGGVLDQSTRQEAARIDALKLPYDILLGLATGGGRTAEQQSGILDPIATIAGGALSGAGAAAGGNSTLFGGFF